MPELTTTLSYIVVHPELGRALPLCVAVVVAGKRSFAAIADWVANVPADLLTELYGRPAC